MRGFVIHRGFRAGVRGSRRGHNGGMPEIPTSDVRLLTPAQVGEVLGVAVHEVMALVMEGRLRGMRVGSPARWRVDEASVAAYLDDETENARRTALWQQAQNASFPELWGSGPVRHSD